MSRSIRGTRKRLERLQTEHYADDELHGELIRETVARIELQDKLKQRVRDTRDQAGLAVAPFDARTVPIELDGDDPLRPPALTAEALRELMERFPPGSLDGLGAVHLRPASRFAYRRRFRYCRDPHTDTPASEVFPGIWGPFLRGQYLEHDRSIHVYAHIHPPGVAPAAAAFIKLRTLVTFAHEAAHHFDFMFRTHGDRWRMDYPRDEVYATRRGFQYVSDFVVPWLQERFPDEHAAFQAWAVEHGGVPLRLALFADEKAGRSSPLEEAFEGLVRSVIKGRDAATTKAAWARDLYESFGPEDAYRVLAGALEAQPDHAEALVARSWIDCTEGRGERAEASLRAVLAAMPEHLDAWETLCLLYQEQRRWAEMAEAATQELAVRSAAGDDLLRALEDRAHAWLALGRWELVAADIATMGASGDKDDRLSGEVFQAMLQCHRGEHAEALALSVRLLADDYSDFGEVLRAVRFESAHRLGRPAEAGTLSRRDLAHVERILPDWHTRLVAITD